MKAAMKRRLSFVLCVAVCVWHQWAVAQCSQPTWTLTDGGPVDDTGDCLLLHSDGHLYLAGTTDSGGSGQNISLTKMSLSGSVVWAKALHFLGDDSGTSVSIHEGNSGSILLGGHCNGAFTTSNGIVAKLDTAGQVLWATRIMPGQGASYVRAVIETPQGDVYASGTTDAIGAGSSDAMLAKFSTGGAMLWLKTWGGAANDHLTDLTMLGDGSIMLNGEVQSFFGSDRKGWYLRCDANGNVLSSWQYGGSGDGAILTHIRNADGTFLHTGLTNAFGQGGYDVQLMLTDSLGAEIWSAAYGTAAAERGMNAVSTWDGGWVISGVNISTSELFLFKVDSVGVLEWAVSPDDLNSTYPVLYADHVVQLEDSSSIVTGTGYAQDPDGDARAVRVNGCGQLPCGADTVLLVRTPFVPTVLALTAIPEASSTAFAPIVPVVSILVPPLQNTVLEICPGSCIVEVNLPSMNSCAYSLFEFVPLVSMTNGTVGQWVWDFGDGSFSTDSGTVQHSYIAQGTYIVTLIVVDQLGNCSDTIQTQIIIGPPESAGADSSLVVCSMDVSFNLFDLLGPIVNLNGDWLDPFGSMVSPLFDPAVDPEGLYTYIIDGHHCGPDTAYVFVDVDPCMSVAGALGPAQPWGIHTQQSMLLIHCPASSGPFVVQVLDALGRAVCSGTTAPGPNGYATIELPAMAPGIYVVLIGGNPLYAQRVLVR